MPPLSTTDFSIEKTELSPIAQARMDDLASSWKMLLYFLKNLPSAIWWGLRVKSLSATRCETTIPFSWRTQNPFRSIYFAALAGAGELSTGLLCNIAMAGKGKISMLVLEQKAEFVKKADTVTTFTCEQGMEVNRAVSKAIEANEPQVITMKSTGRNASGEIVCHIYITWTFKAKSTIYVY